jgi:DNA-binding LacI/PurR family transcriptional regulator
VSFEQQKAAFHAVDYLIRQGHREIACITGPIATPTALARLAGYRQALEHHTIAFDDARVAYGDSSVQSGHQAVRSLLAGGSGFSALFACNDDMAVGAMKALHDAGKRLPQDVSLFGFDDEPSAAYLQPALSTVYLPIDVMIEAAISQAFRLIKGEDIQPLTPFTGELRLRESVVPGPYAD